MRVEVELSGESLPLARAELEATAESLGGVVLAKELGIADRTLTVELPDRSSVSEAMRRLALARRGLVRVASMEEAPAWLALHATKGRSAAFRRRAHPTGQPNDPLVAGLARAWTERGGTIDLTSPDRRFWISSEEGSGTYLLEEVGVVDRPSLAARRISRLPFQRPVGLDPRLARAAANLAGAEPGVRIVDPFVGTGALLAEAALLGAEIVGVDLDPQMIRGTARNLEHVGRPARRLIAGDAGEVANELREERFDAVLTDAPYGRSSGTGGEAVPALLARVVPAWAALVRPGGRLVIVTAGGPDPIGAPWRRVVSVPVRQHRSLTREFRVYRAPADQPTEI